MLLGQLKPKDFDFWTSLHTRWRDMDALGHVNHTAFLSYMETARVDSYIQLGFEVELIKNYGAALRVE